MSDVLGELARGMVGLLNLAFAGDGARALACYPDARRPAPLKQTLVAVGVKDAQALPCALGDCAGVDENGALLRGRTLEATVAMTVCAPAGATAAECQRVFGVIAEALLFGQEEYDVTRVWCGDTAFERELGALALPCCARVRLTLRGGAAAGGVRDITVRRAME